MILYYSYVGGVDYDNATLTALFVTGNTVATIAIPIINDTVVDEGDEEFNVSLSLLPTTNVRVTLGHQSTATVAIIDTSMLILI